jgi:hypothetical protein
MCRSDFEPAMMLERLLDFAENVKGDVRSTEKRFKNGVQEQFRKD